MKQAGKVMWIGPQGRKQCERLPKGMPSISEHSGANAMGRPALSRDSRGATQGLRSKDGLPHQMR